MFPFLSWLCVFSKMFQNLRKFDRALVVAAGGLFLSWSASNCIYIVEPGERAIKFDRLSGVQRKVGFIVFHMTREDSLLILFRFMAKECTLKSHLFKYFSLFLSK